ncbi:monofunctional biosynthetic peptidoglycan transglycosylase [Anseongella ginsenosidimutans]|nr:monofunctional biosynthetic peptidoglycan transglycosylase [Anseongella ginsenosidimutans]QEC53923.1 monofunctional biosynthetic peptidoglycan transglycosylase [Anseongella ginsenosidimutans]
MRKRVLRFIGKVLLWYVVITVSWVIIYRFVPPPVTFLMTKRLYEQFRDDRPLKLKKDWKSLKHISAHLPSAAIAAEDQRFLTHNGFDWKAIQRAYRQNQNGKRIRGGSTISQQVAKNVFLWPGRSYVRKGFEAYFTVLIELFWGKKRIMEVYLNVAEMGIGVYGAEAAAWYYFDKPASQLSRYEAALIAAILPNPTEYPVRNPGPYVSRRARQIMRYMQPTGF